MDWEGKPTEKKRGLNELNNLAEKKAHKQKHIASALVGFLLKATTHETTEANTTSGLYFFACRSLKGSTPKAVSHRPTNSRISVPCWFLRGTQGTKNGQPRGNYATKSVVKRCFALSPPHNANKTHTHTQYRHIVETVQIGVGPSKLGCCQIWIPCKTTQMPSGHGKKGHPFWVG